MNRIRPVGRRMLSLEVVRSERISERFLLLTVGGEDLAEFVPLGVDQAFRLLFRRPGQERLWMPSATGSGWMAQYLLAGRERPFVRLYTVRAYRPREQELDILFALHDGDSPASAWAQRACPGERLGLFDEGATYAPDAGVEWQLLVGDESAVPAVLSVLEADRRTLRSEVFLEVPGAADVQKLHTAPNVTVRWLPREGRGGIPGRYALETVKAAELPAGRFAAFVAGENGLPPGLRRHLVTERGAAKSDISFVGYWRHGKASPG